MAYVDVKNQFMALLNRRDITPSLVDTFMTFGVQRIQRELRVPSMEKLVTFTTDGSAQLAMPTDLLEFINLFTNDQVNDNRLVRTDLQTILRESMIPGVPQFYYRTSSPNRIIIGPYPPSGTKIFLHYYADSQPLSADADENWITLIAPTLLVYAALSYAADYFLDDRKNMFENSYLQIAGQLANQALQDEVANASIRTGLNMDY